MPNLGEVTLPTKPSTGRKWSSVRSYGNCACGTFTRRVVDNEPVCDRCYAIERRMYNLNPESKRRIAARTEAVCHE